MKSTPQSWRLVLLKDLVLPIERSDPAKKFKGEFQYIDISAVDSSSKRLIGDLNRSAKNAPDRARQLVYPADILVSTVRPGLNAVAEVPLGMMNAVASTGFCVLRTRTALLLTSYLFHFVCTRTFIDTLVSRQKGGAYPAVTDADVLSIPIPLPPISEQQRIVEILREAEKIRRFRAQAEAKTAELIPSIFQEVFGDIGVNSKGWPLIPVSSFVDTFKGGKSLAGVEGDFDQSRPRVLKISAVTSGFLRPSESKALPANYEAPREHFVREGDLLITRANTKELVGATALVKKGTPSNLVLPDKIWRFVWKNEYQGTPEFVWALFQNKVTRKALESIASGTGGSMKNIGMGKLMQMRVVWPPKHFQEIFSKALREVLKLSDDSDGSKASSALQSSLSAYAFSGRLTAKWREEYHEELVAEVRERDAALSNSGVVPSRSRRATIQEEQSIQEERTDGIYAELNREQHHLLREINRLVGGVTYPRYFSAKKLGDYLVDSPLHRNHHIIEGHLAVLATRGLVISVSREEQTEDTGEFVFGNTYRLPLDDYEPQEGQEGESRLGDHSRLRELERLTSQVK